MGRIPSWRIELAAIGKSGNISEFDGATRLQSHCGRASRTRGAVCREFTRDGFSHGSATGPLPQVRLRIGRASGLSIGRFGRVDRSAPGVGRGRAGSAGAPNYRSRAFDPVVALLPVRPSQRRCGHREPLGHAQWRHRGAAETFTTFPPTSRRHVATRDVRMGASTHWERDHRPGTDRSDHRVVVPITRGKRRGLRP